MTMRCLVTALVLSICVQDVFSLRRLVINDIDSRRENVEGSKTEYITVDQQTRMFRRKRGTEHHVDFPKKLGFNLKFADRDVSLRLKRHEYMKSDIQMTDNGGRIQHDLGKKAGLYRDHDHQAAFVVQCEHFTEQCTLRGSMVLDGEKWNIAPEAAGSTIHRAVKTEDEGKIRLGKGIPQIPIEKSHKPARVDTEKRKRQKRAIPTNCDIVECFAIVDESVWEFYYNMSSQNVTAAHDAIAAYYLALYAEADIHYDQVGFRRNGGCIRLYLAGIHIQKSSSESWSFPNELELGNPDIAYVEGVGGLFSCGEQGDAFRNSTFTIDLVQCFTRKDIVWNKNSGRPSYSSFYRELSFRGSVCNPEFDLYTAGVLETLGDKVELLIARVVAVGLGAKIDGDSGCADDDGYIMSSEVTINKDKLKLKNIWYFSTCSVDQIYTYLDSQDSCLRDNSFTTSQYDSFEDQPLAGLEYSLKEQCEARFGNGSVPCDPTGQNRTQVSEICKDGMYCTVVEFGDGDCTGQTRPFDGSSCGTFGSFCLEGQCIIRKGLGENCSSHTECSSSNAECSFTNSTCVCANGFYDDNGGVIGGTCSPQVGVGEACPQPDACLDVNSECISGNCTCLQDYYTDSGACFLLKSIGSSCNSSDECAGNNTECTGSPSTCRCPSDRYLNINTGNCDTKKALGESCSRDIECNASNTECSLTNSTCVCTDGFYDDNGDVIGGTCAAQVGVGETCPQPDACLDVNSECISGNCTCLQDYYTDSGACFLLKSIGSSCNSSKECAGNNTECSGSPSTCRCPSDRYLNINTGNCDTKKALGEGCSSEIECNASNTECGLTNSTCVCTGGFYDDNGDVIEGTCVTQVGVGETCPQPDACLDVNSECISGNCTCLQDYYTDSGACFLLKNFGSSCNSSDECAGNNTECTGSPFTCRCPSDRYLNINTGHCDTKKALGEGCSSDIECNASNTECSFANSTCVCTGGFYDDNGDVIGGTCVAVESAQLGGACSQSDACVDINAECRSGNCTCRQGYYTDTGACFVLKTIGSSCNSSDECAGNNTECTGSPSTCRCPSDRYLNINTGNCDTKKALGSSCEPGECDEQTNAVCHPVTKTCRCPDGLQINGTVCQLQCPDGFDQFQNSCYFFGTENIFYQPARNFCDSFDSDLFESNLVQVDTVEELDYLKAEMEVRGVGTKRGYWNDLFQNTTDGNEIWRTSGDPLIISDWANKAPKDGDVVFACTAFWKRKDYKQIDLECKNDITAGQDDKSCKPLCEIKLV